MLFGDQPRFSPQVQSAKLPSYVYGKGPTGRNVGPGTHFERDLADKRSGWKPNTKSVREPMVQSPREKRTCRSDYYIKGQLTSSGIVVPYSPDKMKYPSPGQYEPSMKMSTFRSQSAGRLSPTSSMGTSARLAPPNTTLRGNVLFTACSVHDSLRLSLRGPGLYFQSDDLDVRSVASGSRATSPLRRKSFNVRSQSGNSHGRQTAQRQIQHQKSNHQSQFLTSPIKKTQHQRPTSAQSHEGSRSQIRLKKAWSDGEDRDTNRSIDSKHTNTPHRYEESPRSTTPLVHSNRYTPYRTVSEEQGFIRRVRDGLRD